MKQVRIILKNGKEIQWEAESSPKKEIMQSYACFGAVDGKEFYITEDEIAAIIITPMVKCPKCGEWQVPNKQAFQFLDVRLTEAMNSCSKCGHEITELYDLPNGEKGVRLCKDVQPPDMEKK